MKKINLITYFTPSHKVFYDDYFLPSFKKHSLDQDFNLIVETGEQVAENGDYYSKGFNGTTVDKLSSFSNHLNVGDSNPLMFADADIQFLGNFKDDIVETFNSSGCDILFQSDITNLCTGVFICKQSKLVKQLLEEALELTPRVEHEQVAINMILQSNNLNIKYDTLDPTKYFTIGYSTKGTQWTPETVDLDIPKTILMHHANWTAGVENKIKLLNFVKATN